MLSLPNGTLLVITPVSGKNTPVLTPYSARGLTQTLEWLGSSGGQGSAWLRRDVNAVLRSVADTRFRKYKSKITCRDGETPCLDDAWIGETVEVACALELSYPHGGSPARMVVPGSQRSQGLTMFYRPLLVMMVADIQIGSFAEWQALYDWSIELEEV